MVSLEDIVDTGTTLAQRGYSRVSPHFVPKILVNMAAGHISLKHNLKVCDFVISVFFVNLKIVERDLLLLSQKMNGISFLEMDINGCQ